MALELHNGLSHLNPVIGASAGLPLPMSLMEVELQNFATPLQAVVDSVVEAVAARKAARGHVVTAATFGGCGIEFRIPQHILRRRGATGTTESVFNGDRMQSEWQDDDEEVWEEQVAADDANTTAADLDIPDEIADLPMGHAAAGVEGEGMSGGGPQETEDAGAPHGDAPAAADVPPEAPKATEVEEDGEEGEEGVGLAIAKDQVVSKTGRANAARAKEAFRLRDDVNVDDKTMSKKEREAHARAVRNAGIDIYADEDGEVEIGLGFGTARFSAYDVETLGLPDAPTKPQDADAVVARWTALCAEEGEAFEAAGEPVAPSVTGAAGLQGRPKSDYSQIARNVEAISEFLMGNAEDCPRGNPANARLTSFNRQMFYDNLCCIRVSI